MVLEEKQLPAVFNYSAPVYEEPTRPLRLLDGFKVYTIGKNGSATLQHLETLAKGPYTVLASLPICQSANMKVPRRQSSAIIGSAEECLTLQFPAGGVVDQPLQATGLILDHKTAETSLSEARKAAYININIRKIKDWVIDHSQPQSIWIVTNVAWYRCAQNL